MFKNYSFINCILICELFVSKLNIHKYTQYIYQYTHVFTFNVYTINPITLNVF